MAGKKPCQAAGLSVSSFSTRCKGGNSRPRRCLRLLFHPLESHSTKFHGKSRTRRFAPRTQFAAKFPCRCRRRRHVSADGDDFRLFDSLSPAGRQSSDDFSKQKRSKQPEMPRACFRFAPGGSSAPGQPAAQPKHFEAAVPVGLVALKLLGAQIAFAGADRKSTRLNSSHTYQSRMPSSA